MARIRSIKPEMWESEKAGKMSVLARLTFVGLISLADDEGRGRGDVVFLQARLHAYAKDVKPEAFAKALQEIHDAKLAMFYVVEDCSYYQLPGWAEHQRVDHPSKSTIPAFREDYKNAREDSREEGKGEEGKGEEGKGKDVCAEPPKALAAEDIPAVIEFPVVGKPGGQGWPLREDKLAEYRESYPGVDVLVECKKALQWLRDRPNRRKTPRGMPAFLSSWLGRAQNWQGERRNDVPRPNAGYATPGDAPKQRRIDN